MESEAGTHLAEIREDRRLRYEIHPRSLFFYKVDFIHF